MRRGRQGRLVSEVQALGMRLVGAGKERSVFREKRAMGQKIEELGGR
jgi:hypothetical protein